MNLPLPRPVWPWAIVEITNGGGAERALIEAAYAASRGGVVALALRGVSAESVDRVLDDVVDPRDAAVHGVIYLDGNDAAAVAAAVAHAKIVIAASAVFREQLEGLGVAALHPDQGSAQLALARDDRAAVRPALRASA